MERPSERLKRKVLVENLWIYILKEMKKGHIYGFEIREKAKKEFGFWIGNVTAYKVLYQLERGRYIESRKEGAKIVYSITPKGRRELGAGIAFLKKIAK